MTPAEYQFKVGFELRGPMTDRYVLAVNSQGFPHVWALQQNINEEWRWIVTIDPNGQNYMFSDDGLFGWTPTPGDRFNNSYPSPYAAIMAFHKFYR